MNRHLLLAGALTFLGAVACTDDRAPEPTSPNFMTGATCKYSDVKKYAKNLFGSPSPGYSLAQQISGFTKDSPEATGIAFQIFAAIAQKRNETPDFSAFVSDAANLSIQTANCADVTAGNDPVTLAAFTLSLGPSGGYAVPGTGVGSLFAKDLQASVNSPSTGFGTWLSNKPALFFGYVPQTAQTPGESQVGFTGRKVYTWSILRPVGSPGLVGKGSVSLCVLYDELAVNGDQFRVQKLTNILENQDRSLPCNAALLASAATVPTGFFAGLVHRVGTWLAPQPLHAVLATTKTPTGSGGNFSNFYVVNPNSVNISFSVKPVDGTVSGGIPGVGGQDVTVLVEGAGHTPWTGVEVEVFGTDNNGNFVSFSGNTGTTGSNGKVSFPDLAPTQTGAYRMYAATFSSDPDLDIAAFTPDTTAAAVKIIVRP
jgi:hypothetical protein